MSNALAHNKLIGITNEKSLAIEEITNMSKCCADYSMLSSKAKAVKTVKA